MKKKLNRIFLFFSQNSWTVFFLLGLVVLTWFKPNSIITGGDFGWPVFFSNFINRVFYIWDSSVNFGYLAARQLNSIYPYAIWGYFLQFLGFNIQQVQFIIFYISFVFSGLGMFLLASRLDMNKTGSIISGIFYMFSPYALIVTWVPSYGIIFPFYCFLPISLYLFISFLTENNKNKRISSIIVLFLSFFGVTYSNPAYFIIYLGLILFIFLYFSFLTKDLKSFIHRLLLFIFIYFLLNSFWIIPFVFDLSNQFTLSNNIIAGLINDHENFKLNSVFLYDAFRMIGLWSVKAGQFTDYYYDWRNLVDSKGFVLFSFFLSILVFFSFLIKNKKNRFILMISILFCIGILFNSGAKHDNFLNTIVSIFFKTPLIERAFRSVYTKLGVLLVLPIVFLSSYTVSFLLSLIKTKLIKFTILLFFLIAYFYFIGQSFFNGQIIKSNGKSLPGYNINIPSSYFKFKNIANKQRSDDRTLSLPLPKSYNLLLKWGDGGYNGADFLSSFLTKSLVFMYDGSPIINLLINNINHNNDNSLSRILNILNINYIFSHKDLSEYGKSQYLTNSKIYNVISYSIIKNKLFDISVLNNNFFPHFFTPQILITTSQKLEILPKILSQKDYNIRSAIYFKNVSKVKIGSKVKINFDPAELKKETVNNTPVLEFKKINPTKYRVVVHGAKGEFPIVFSESFHEGWKTYLASPDNLKFEISNLKSIFNDQIIKYKILDGNTEDQASREELKSFIDNGWITTLGNGKEKVIKHQKWKNNREVLDYVEKYNIDFVSKNFQDTIQNDNLSSGKFYETWFKKPIEDNKNHLMVNGYANSWMIDTNKICGLDSRRSLPSTPIGGGNDGGMCIKNPDESYDFEVVVEFWPQRLFYFGLFISGTTLLSCIGYLIFNSLKKPKHLKSPPQASTSSKHSPQALPQVSTS